MAAPESRPEFGEFISPQWTKTQLCRLLRDYFRRTRPDIPVRVGTDLPFFYSPTDRLARVVPDLYVMEGIDQEEQLRWFRVWERGRSTFCGWGCRMSCSTIRCGFCRASAGKKDGAYCGTTNGSGKGMRCG